MPRQNTSPSDFPATVRQQIAQLAQRITAERKHRGATQVQWAEQLGISQPTMARLERGDPAVSMATYVACLTLIHPQLNLVALLPHSCAAGTTALIAPGAGAASDSVPQPSQDFPSLAPSPLTGAAMPPSTLSASQQEQVAQQFAAAKAALEGFKSPGF